MAAFVIRLVVVVLVVTCGRPAAAQPPEPPPAESFVPAPFRDRGDEPRYVVEAIEIRGNHKTQTAIIRAELGLGPGDIITASDTRVTLAKLRLQSLGYFLDVNLSLSKGSQRGAVVLVVDVQERGTIVLNSLHLGTSEATAFWGGLDVTERNFLGRGYSVGGGFVAATAPKVAEANRGHALSLRAVGPPHRTLGLSGTFLISEGSEFFRTFGSDDSADVEGFVALDVKRIGGTAAISTDLSRTTRVTAEGRFESINARWPSLRARAFEGGGLERIDFGVQNGRSQLSSLSVLVDHDTRSDPVLPHDGHRLVLSLETALPFLGSRYVFSKAVFDGAFYIPNRWGHAWGLHVFAGGIVGEAPYFDRFFVGDLNFLLPPRALGLNFSTLPSRNILGTRIASHRYDPFAARVLVEYAVPMWRRRGFFYRGDAFVAAGAFGMADLDDLRARDTTLGEALPVDLTADCGLRLDTFVGIFKLSIANVLGRVPL